jgi:hypothetical protein
MTPHKPASQAVIQLRCSQSAIQHSCSLHVCQPACFAIPKTLPHWHAPITPLHAPIAHRRSNRPWLLFGTQSPSTPSTAAAPSTGGGPTCLGGGPARQAVSRRAPQRPQPPMGSTHRCCAQRSCIVPRESTALPHKQRRRLACCTKVAEAAFSIGQPRPRPPQVAASWGPSAARGIASNASKQGQPTEERTRVPSRRGHVRHLSSGRTEWVIPTAAPLLQHAAAPLKKPAPRLPLGAAARSSATNPCVGEGACSLAAP